MSSAASRANAPLRIALIAYACDPVAGSEPGNGWAWAEHLASRGHEVRLLTRPEARDRIEDRLRLSNLPITPLYLTAEPLPTGLPQRVAMYLHYRRFLRRASHTIDNLTHVDVAHHATWGSLLLGSVESSSAPLVLGPVGGGQTSARALAPLFGDAWPAEWIRNQVVRGMRLYRPARRAATRAAVVLATNPETRQRAEALGAQRVEHFLADGVARSDSHLRPRRLSQAPTLLWVGRMLPIKAAELSIRVHARVREVYPHAQLILIGSGPRRQAAERLTRHLNLTNNVEFVGQVPRQEVDRYYAKADLLLFTSLRDSFGAQTLEAASYGVPSVLLQHTGAGRYLSEVGAARAVPATGDADALAGVLAHAVVGTLQDSDAYDQMRAAALNVAHAERWSERAERIERIYRQVLK